MTLRSAHSAILSTLVLLACSERQTDSPVTAPGAEASVKTRSLEAGAAVLQNRPPVDSLNAYLDGFHFYNGQMRLQMEAHHYCAILNDEVIQCVIYDGNTKDAKLMGVEYIVSAKLFAALPLSERALWHSHVHEVKSGQLIAPGIPQAAEHELMRKIIGTYGKTWHTWHTDMHHDLPISVPQLMMGFTADGQADPAMVAARNRRFGIDSEVKRRDRANLEAPSIDPGADAWKRGKAFQLGGPNGTFPSEAHPSGETSKPVDGKANATSDKR